MTQAEQLAAQAAQWQAAGRADMAAQLYSASLEQDPSKFAIRMQLAECLVQLQQTDTAAENYLMVAQAYAARGRQQECLAICERIIAIAPHAFVYMSVGPMVRRIGRHARTLCAKSAEAHLGAGRQTDGLQMLRLGAELDPQNPDVRIQLAQIYRSRHMNHEAVDVLSDAGNLLIQAKRYTEYIDIANQILQLDPEDIQTLRDLPRVYLELKKPHEAVTMLGRLTKASPGDIIGYEILAQAFALIGRTDKALSVLERLVEQLGSTGQSDKADAILNHARYWRPTDLGFLRSLKRMEVPRPSPAAQPHAAQDPRAAAPEGTVVLSIADLVVDEGDSVPAAASSGGEGIKLTEAEGTLTLNLSDLILSEMEQAAGHGVSRPTLPPTESAPSSRSLPSAKDVPAGNSTISLDGADLLAALIEVTDAEPEANPFASSTPTRPDRGSVEFEEDAATVAPPGDDAPTMAPPGDDAPTMAPPGDDAPTMAPPGGDAASEDDAPTVAPPGINTATMVPTGNPSLDGSTLPPANDATVALHLPSSGGDDAPTMAPGLVPPYGEQAPTLSGIDMPEPATQSMSSLIYDEESDVDEDEEDAEPATLLHMKPLSAEDIAKAIAKNKAASEAAAAPTPAPPPADVGLMGSDDAPTIMRMQPLTAEDIAKAMAKSKAAAEAAAAAAATEPDEDSVTVPPSGAPPGSPDAVVSPDPTAPALLSPDLASPPDPTAPPLLSPDTASPPSPMAPPLLSPNTASPPSPPGPAGPPLLSPDTASPPDPAGPPLLSSSVSVVPNTPGQEEGEEEEEMTRMNMTPLSLADLARGRGPDGNSES